MRDRLNERLNEIRDKILVMGSIVEEELQLALTALQNLDDAAAQEVLKIDRVVNEKRFSIEEECFVLISTQQPVVRDLRSVVAVMHMIVDLERMGDQAKGIAKVIPHMAKYPPKERPSELQLMGSMVREMHTQALAAYANNDLELAKKVTQQDDEVDRLYAQLFHHVMQKITETEDQDKVETTYEILRAGRELERFGDLATNIAERVIYINTGTLDETNVDLDTIPEAKIKR